MRDHPNLIFLILMIILGFSLMEQSNVQEEVLPVYTVWFLEPGTGSASVESTPKLEKSDFYI